MLQEEKVCEEGTVILIWLKKILDISVDTTSSDVLPVYVLTGSDQESYDEAHILHRGDIYSVNTTTSTVAKMQRKGLHFSHSISIAGACHNQFLYIAEEGPAVYKCAIQGIGLRLMLKWTKVVNDVHFDAWYMYKCEAPALAISSSHVFQYILNPTISIIDTDTMTLL